MAIPQSLLELRKSMQKMQEMHNLLADRLQDLRVQITYLKFENEALTREKERLQKMLEDSK
jgi:regulator of replication initiation timing